MSDWCDWMWDHFVRAYAAQVDTAILGVRYSANYQRWRSAFYAERARYMEGGTFAVLADSDAEAIYLITRVES